MARGGAGFPGGMPPGVRPLTAGDPVAVGRYPLLGRLGAGGMGVVYLAEHPGHGLVAVKTPHEAHLADPTLRARFAAEVELSRRVVPFCTAGVIEDGVDGTRPYLVTEYIPGPPLSQVVEAHGPLVPDLAYGVALGTAGALCAIHEAGLVHRDLKPANVLLSPRGPFVIDFGIARDQDAALAYTQAGQIMGSPGWVAPERLTGGRAVPASDVFSWGCLVVYAATGRHPFGRGDLDVLTRRILVEEPWIDGVTGLLRDLAAAALRKDPAARPAAGELLAALLAMGGIAMPEDRRRAVAEILARTWRPVPYPGEPGDRREPERPAEIGRSPEPAESGRSAGPAGLTGTIRRMRAARRRPAGESPARPGRTAGHASQAGFAALATITIATLTMVAAGTGAARMHGTGGEPPAPPLVIPRPEESVIDVPVPAEVPRTPTRSAAARGAPAPRPRPTATPARSARPSRAVKEPIVVSPSPVRGTVRPRPTGCPAGEDPPCRPATPRPGPTATPGEPPGGQSPPPSEEPLSPPPQTGQPPSPDVPSPAPLDPPAGGKAPSPADRRQVPWR